MASRSASRTVVAIIGVPSGTSGSSRVSATSATSSRGAGFHLVRRRRRRFRLGDRRWLAASAPRLRLRRPWARLRPRLRRPSARSPCRPSPRRCLRRPGSCAIVPSSTASNSIVALSVSISARMSPEVTLSPSLTSHLASVPSSMVGESAGILSSIAISSSPPARRCRVRPASGSGASSANSAASTTISLISLSIALSSSSLDAELLQLAWRHARSGRDARDTACTSSRDRYLAGSDMRMAAIAVGLQLEEDRPLARLGPGQRLLGRAAHRQHVHAVDLDAGDAEALAALVELGLGRRALDAGAHRILVVLDHEDDRQLPQLRHVEALVDLALVGRAVAEIGQADAAVARHICA